MLRTIIMRTIKFRGKRIDTGDWVYGGISIFQNEVTIFDQNCVVNSAYEVDKNTVGEFTGLNDKNGVEVFEGDIIKWKETRFHTEEQQKKNVAMPKWFESEVIYDDAGFLVSSSQERDTPLCCFFGDSLDNKFDYKAEIIGNIYDNPGLI